jgi:hypothetical protein
MKKKVIEYYIKDVFGMPRRYIKDPQIADSIRALTQERTLSTVQLVALTELGFELKEVFNPQDR